MIVVEDTKAVQVSDTVGFCHNYLNQPTLTHTDIILHGTNTLSCALKYAPTITCDSQLRAITELNGIFQQWSGPSQLNTVPPLPKPKIRDHGKRRKYLIPSTQNICIHPAPKPPRVNKSTTTTQSPRVHFPEISVPTPRVDTSSPKVETSHPQQAHMPETIDRRTRLHQPPRILIPTDPVVQCMRSHTTNIVSPA